MAKSLEDQTEFVRTEFLKEIARLTEYWASVEGPSTVRDRLSGLVFSTLVLLDGGNGNISGGFNVTPVDDGEYQSMENVKDIDIAGALHDNLYSALRALYPGKYE